MQSMTGKGRGHDLEARMYLLDLACNKEMIEKSMNMTIERDINIYMTVKNST